MQSELLAATCENSCPHQSKRPFLVLFVEKRMASVNFGHLLTKIRLLWWLSCAELKFHICKWPVFCMSKFSARHETSNFCFSSTIKKNRFDWSERGSCKTEKKRRKKQQWQQRKWFRMLIYRECFDNSIHYNNTQMCSKQMKYAHCYMYKHHTKKKYKNDEKV